MELGIFAKTFAGQGMARPLDAVEASGIRIIQFNMSLTGSASLPEQIAADTAESVRAAVAVRGLQMAAVSGTYNMAHPDADQRARGAARLATLIAAAPALGTRVVTICTGTRDPDDMWRAHPDNSSPEAWRDSVRQISQALEVAERHQVILAFEPEHNNVVADAARGRRLLGEIKSDHLRVVIDAANLILPGELGRQSQTLKQAFMLLGDSLVLSHAKDVLADGSIVAAGQGGLDYELYVDLLRDAAYRGPLVLHGLAESEVPAAAEYVNEHLRTVERG
jgi:sugar phosphate isomerase/epimerase